MKKTYNIFLKSLAGVGTVIIIGILLLNRSVKTKVDFTEINGPITYMDTEYENLPTRDNGKYRYIGVGGTQRVFEIFVGNDPDDFSPELERIDELNLGDTISLFHDDNSYTENQLVNSLTRFIDKEQQPYFIEDSGTDRTFAYFLLTLGGILLVIIILLKSKGKIY